MIFKFFLTVPDKAGREHEGVQNISALSGEGGGGQPRACLPTL